MTIKEAYNFLNQPRRLEYAIMKAQMQHDELQSCLLPKAITYDKDKIQTSPGDMMSETASLVLDLERDIRKLYARKAQLIVEINDAISRLDSDTEQMILLGFYVGRLPASRVADLVHYSLRGVYKAKHRAVIHLAEVCTKCSICV